jgi:hypothetical protein
LSSGVTLGTGETGPFRNIQWGPGTLDIGASLRWRFEVLDDFNIQKYGTDSSDQVLLNRVRLDLTYRLNQGPVLFLQGQDARFWFSDDIHTRNFTQSCPYYNEYDLRQAYVEWRTIGKSPLGVKLGRQGLSYGDNRIFGPGEWGNVGRYLWDAGKLLWQSDVLDVDLIYGRRVLYLWNEFDDTHYDDDVYAVYARIKSLGRHRLDLFYVLKDNNDDGSTSGESGIGRLQVQTLGFHGKGAWHQLDYAVTAAYQSGDFGKDDISAYALSTEVGYTFPHRITPRVSAGIDYSSGDKDPTDGDHNTFDAVFGSMDLYYGRMILFSWMNLVDYQTGLSVTPMKAMNVSLEYHWFRLAEKKDAWYYSNGKKMHWDKQGKSGSELSEEFDLICKYKVTAHLELMAGFGIFFPGTFIEKTGSYENAQWFFTQLELSL